ncbi:Abi family protein [Pseudomonas syringae]|uniref:Abi family protein n=1 Tax=Pseudomonas syringae TaxID=317 RepID=UPI00211EE558|nr:Abi family protein [Pseudomonas syringae]
MRQLAPPKPFKSYSDLAGLLTRRGMEVADPLRAERKLSQVGYYRLSGFWFPAREFVRDQHGQVTISNVTQKPVRQDAFAAGTSFDSVVDLYLFDKKLRQLMLDAIERIEIHMRSIIAHEVGFHDPQAYLETRFVNPRQISNWQDGRGRQRNTWNEWQTRQTEQVNRSREDCIEWHRQNYKAMPFWVVVEAWDFGTLSKYFEILKGSYQNRIAARLGISNAKVLKEWLQGISTLRNRSAHHTRIWNQVASNQIPVLPADAYFQALALDQNALSRLYGMISIIWFLLRHIGPGSQWLRQVADIVDTKPDLPGCPFASLGLPSEDGFPRQLFGI